MKMKRKVSDKKMVLIEGLCLVTAQGEREWYSKTGGLTSVRSLIRVVSHHQGFFFIRVVSYLGFHCINISLSLYIYILQNKWALYHQGICNYEHKKCVADGE